MAPEKESPLIERLIHRQIKEWDLKRRLAEEGAAAGTHEIPRLPEGPWISFSKQLGSDAIRIARILGEKLGWQIFDKEIVEAIARETHSRQQILSRLDEKAVGRFEDLLNQLLVPEHLDHLTYLREMGKVIWALARQGRVILLGRGANWFLDSRFGIRVRTVAPFEIRAKRIAERDGIILKDAERKVRAADAARAAFIRQVYHRDIDDPLGYDLVVNTEQLGPEPAAEAVRTALEAKLRGIR
jgi:hypothetical protein